MFIQKSKVKKKAPGDTSTRSNREKEIGLNETSEGEIRKGRVVLSKPHPSVTEGGWRTPLRERNRAYRDHLTSKIPKSPHFSTPLRYTLTYPPKRSAKSDEVLKGLPQPPFAIYLTPLVKKRQQRSQKKFTRIS